MSSRLFKHQMASNNRPPVYPLMYVGMTFTPYNSLYQLNPTSNAFTKLSQFPINGNDSTSWGYGVCFSMDGKFLVTQMGSGNPELFKKGANYTFVKLSFTGHSGGMARGITFSRDDKYVAMGTANYPYLAMYRRDGDVFTKLPNPAQAPTGTGFGAALSPDGKYVAVSSQFEPYFHLYKKNADDTLTKLPNPASMPGNYCENGIRFSPDGKFLVVPCAAAAGVKIYSVDSATDTFTALPISGDLAKTYIFSAAFSHDSKYLAIGYMMAPCVQVFKIEGTTFTKLPNLPTLPDNRVWDLAWSRDSKYLAATSDDSEMRVYQRVGDTFTRIASPSGMTTSRSVDFSPAV